MWSVMYETRGNASPLATLRMDISTRQKVPERPTPSEQCTNIGLSSVRALCTLLRDRGRGRRTDGRTDRQTDRQTNSTGGSCNIAFIKLPRSAVTVVVIIKLPLSHVRMYGTSLKKVNIQCPFDNYGTGCAMLTVWAWYGYRRCFGHVAPTEVGARWWSSFGEMILNVSRFRNRCT